MIDEKKLLKELDDLPFIHGKYDKKNANKHFIHGAETMYDMIVEKIIEQTKIDEK